MQTRASFVPASPFVLAVLALAASAGAQVLRVPSQHPTIGAALAAATGPGTILVAAGVYAERLTWPNIDGIRLIGESGAAATVIDGGNGGTVVTFSAGRTRSTVLAGFTITNGFLQGTHNDGAGINVYDSSPTIRDNRLTHNTTDSLMWNYGGAIFVGGGSANPLISHNEIDDNELRNGSWNYGAGIHIASGARADIVGNHIHDNRNHTVLASSIGRGHGAGVYCAGTALIASNLIAGNTNSTSAWNYGGGIAVASSGSASVFNNTIVGNTLTGGNWRYGGGLYVESSATLTMRGNIVAQHTAAGVYRSGTGSGVVDTDYDDVWNNSPDYASVTAGPNNLSVDPQFVGATDFHLAATSPCIDAIPATHLTTVVAMDLDEDPRRLDGDLDGGSTDGARLDLGADEFSSVRLAIVGAPQIGTTVQWSLNAAQPSLYLFAVSLDVGNTLVEPYGNLLLGSSAFLVGLGTTPGALGFSIPNDASLRGVVIYGQGLVLPFATGVAGQFTNLATLTTW